MIQGPGKNWGLRAAVCAAVVAWQIGELASARAVFSNESDALRYLVIGAALIGLVASMVKLIADY